MVLIRHWVVPRESVRLLQDVHPPPVLQLRPKVVPAESVRVLQNEPLLHCPVVLPHEPVRDEQVLAVAAGASPRTAIAIPAVMTNTFENAFMGPAPCALMPSPCVTANPIVCAVLRKLPVCADMRKLLACFHAKWAR